ncbi:MAG: gamma carbonic anhydrase family protein [Granulosicoccus sp.]
MLYALNNKKPIIEKNTYVAPSAVLIGDVVIGEYVSIWFNAVLRGDNDTIIIGEGSNVQDGCILHVDEGVPITVGKRVTIGHKAILHGCQVDDDSLIGMNAVVLNNAVIGKNCLIGANALVTEGMHVPDGSLVLGSPAKIIKPVSPAALDSMRAGAQGYIRKIGTYNDSLVLVE